MLTAGVTPPAEYVDVLLNADSAASKRALRSAVADACATRPP
ncbi:hypothetical protein OU415_20940 [Saccharopolyspora sp. WRP15-2]|uniref:Uncharacterized protein n=1 Tax=Saccharopolyspora oryzae TaxID=2997343 RepID=A0ABT4V1U3_9PSEU|nr:hypothetical protein [Saccharopolyspora oryzae]MDA3627913.1 hypothetical protein [Saccharopolyspora oryzae]